MAKTETNSLKCAALSLYNEIWPNDQCQQELLGLIGELFRSAEKLVVISVDINPIVWYVQAPDRD